MWLGPERSYIVADQQQMPRFVSLVGQAALHVVMRAAARCC